MSRIVTIHCSRCGATILGGHSILKIEAGTLADRIEGEPYIDLCPSCVDRFLDWLRQGKPNALGGVGTAPVGMVRELDTVAR